MVTTTYNNNNNNNNNNNDNDNVLLWPSLDNNNSINNCQNYGHFFSFSFVFGLFIFFSVLGRKPYSGLGGIEIVDFLKSGKRLQQPDGCSDEM